jgi:hypothetical protein
MDPPVEWIYWDPTKSPEENYLKVIEWNRLWDLWTYGSRTIITPELSEASMQSTRVEIRKREEEKMEKFRRAQL